MKCCGLAETVLNPEPAAWIGPFDIVELIANNPASPAFDTTLVGEEHRTVVERGVTGGGTAIDALLPFAFEACLAVDDRCL